MTTQNTIIMQEYIGKRIREIRKLKLLTQGQLAKRLNISYQQVHKYESGVNQVSLDKLFQIADILEVSCFEFFPPDIIKRLGVNTNALSTSKLPETLDEDTLKLIKLFQSIKNPKIRKSCISLLNSLAQESKVDTNEIW